MSYCPKIREDLLSKLYKHKHSLEKKKPITKLVNEAVEEYLIGKVVGCEESNKIRSELAISIDKSQDSTEGLKSLQREFLCTLEFISGEYEIIFYQIVKALTIKTAEVKIDKWLKGFYPGQFDKRVGRNYYYFNGKVAVKLDSVQMLDKDYFIQLLTIN